MNYSDLTEKKFDQRFYALDDPLTQISHLGGWRKHQTTIVSRFIDQISLFAKEHYTNLDHFLLELLQNADDNSYPDGSMPTVKMILEEGYFTLINNEKGFTPEDLYAITYAAASTKIRDKRAGTYIGEKGIGFKSVFAVADWVEIHSPPYHFKLKNKEFVIPHPIEAENLEGTKIVLKLRKENKEIPNIISSRLKTLCKSAQEFIIFLQNVERLEIDDKFSGTKGTVQVMRDKSEGIYVIESRGQKSTFIVYSYNENIPKTIVNERFDALNKDLVREIIFAIPLPKTHYRNLRGDGRLFSFLPTDIMTATPIHIQVDAKTTSNREDFIGFSGSNWNRSIFKNFIEHMVSAYVKLTQVAVFNYCLPLYWPKNCEDIKNADFKDLIQDVKKALQDQPVVLDRHGCFKKPEFVGLLPEPLEQLKYEKKYERAISEYIFGYGFNDEDDSEDGEEEDRFTFVNRQWVKEYKNELEEIGVEELDFNACIAMLREGPPRSVKLDSDGSVRRFMSLIMKYCEWNKEMGLYYWVSNERQMIRRCPIFPVKVGGRREWRCIDDEVMWLQSNTPRPRVSKQATVIDPTFTYTPGGSEKERKKIAKFNKEFCNFLEDTLSVSRYSIEEFLKNTTITELMNLDVDINDVKERRKINDLWVDIYRSIWKRRRTIIQNENEEYWEELMSKLAECLVPTMRTGTNEWELALVKNAFLGRKLYKKRNLGKIYSGTWAPFIVLDFVEEILEQSGAKKIRKIDWQDWADFLLECKANIGPHIISLDLSTVGKYRYSTATGYRDVSNTLAQKIKEAIESHEEYRNERTESFRLKFPGSYTVALDPYSEELMSCEKSDFLAKDISKFWGNLKDYQTDIPFLWGNKRKPRFTSTEHLLIFDQIKHPLLVKSSKGLVPSRDCILDDRFNRGILRDLAAYVKPKRYDVDLLKSVGLTEVVDSTYLDGIIKRWYENSSESNRKSKEFLAYVESVVRYCRINDGGIPDVHSRIKLYAQEKDDLLPFDSWLTTISTGEYPTSVVEELKTLLLGRGVDDPALLINHLMNLDNLEGSENILASVIRDIGRNTGPREAEELKEEFQRRLDSEGLDSFEETIRSIDKLPIMWDKSPFPRRAKDEVICIPPFYWNDGDYSMGARFLNWPTLSMLPHKLSIVGPAKAPERNLARKISNIWFELLGSISTFQPQIRSKMETLGLFGSLETIDNQISFVNSIQLKVTRGTVEMNYKVPYWFEEGALVIDKDTRIEHVLPEFIDMQCGSTFSGNFKYIWEDPKLAGRSFRDTPAVGKPTDPPPLDGSITEDSTFRGKKDMHRAGAQGQRKRLLSYVAPPGHHLKARETEGMQERNKNIESAGTKVLINFFKSQGIEPHSVEAENKGYDFEVIIGNQNLYLEVKSSEDEWSGWEHLLTPNEFFTAREYGKDYFLCIVDQVLSEKPQIYFIQDPVNNADGFLFDDPWQEIGFDTVSFLAEFGLNEPDI